MTYLVSFMFKNENNGVVGIEELAFPDNEMVDVYTLPLSINPVFSNAAAKESEKSTKSA